MPTDTASSQNPPDLALAHIVFGKGISMAVSVVAKLRVADLLADGPKTLAELATKTNTHAPSLYRVLRLMASVDIFAEQGDGRFALTPMGEYLRTGVKGSLRGIADYCGSQWSWRSWGQLLETVQTGRTAFDDVWASRFLTILASTPTSRRFSTRA